MPGPGDDGAPHDDPVIGPFIFGAGRLIKCPYSTLFVQLSIARLELLDLPEEDRLEIGAPRHIIRTIEDALDVVDAQLRRMANDEAKANQAQNEPAIRKSVTMKVCQEVRMFNELPAGERRMLERTRTAAFARQVLNSDSQ